MGKKWQLLSDFFIIEDIVCFIASRIMWPVILNALTATKNCRCHKTMTQFFKIFKLTQRALFTNKIRAPYSERLIHKPGIHQFVHTWICSCFANILELPETMCAHIHRRWNFNWQLTNCDNCPFLVHETMGVGPTGFYITTSLPPHFYRIKKSAHLSALCAIFTALSVRSNLLPRWENA